MSVRVDRDGPVLTLTIDRPEQRNSLDRATLDGLLEGLTDARADDDVRVVVLTGAGDRAFCAGADLGASFEAATELGVVGEHEARGVLLDLFSAIDDLDKPLVGRVNGHALAGGFGVALACDLLVAVDTATFGTPEVKVGLWPFVVSQLVVEHIGPKRALDLMLTGRRIDASEALTWGLLNHVVPAVRLDETVEEVCRALIAGSPVAQRLGRRSFVTTRGLRRSEAMPYLHAMLDLAARTEDIKEGITAFLEKREPDWPGR